LRPQASAYCSPHDPNHALRAADRAYLIRDSARIADGAVRDVLTRGMLEHQCRAPVEQLDDPATGSSAFPPGWNCSDMQPRV
jgi:iron complex transport system ATP-binding protein